MSKQIYITTCTNEECNGKCRPETPKRKRASAYDEENYEPTEKQVSEKEVCETRIKEDVCGFCGSKLKLDTLD